MKRRHLWLVAISLIISICMCFSLAACDSCDKNDETPTALTTPTVTIDDKGVASWEAVENASGYAYKINDGTEVETSELSRTLSVGEKIAVKAIGDGKHYTDSSWSETKTYTKQPATQPTTLGKPVVTIADDGTASWAAVANASKYAYKINDGAEQETTALSVKLTDGQKIVVKAVGNGTTYSDGAWSDAKTYTAPHNPDVHGHEYGAWEDNGDGTHTGTCQNTVGTCGNPTHTESHTYDKEDNTKCVCGATKPAGGDTHNHEYDYTNNNDGTHNGVCECGEDPITNEDHTIGADGMSCTKCNFVDIPADALTAETTIEDYAKAQDPVWTNGTKYAEVKLDNKFTVTATGGSNTGKYYDSNNSWRIYQNENPTLKIEAEKGYEILAVVITYKSASNGILADKADATKTFASEEVIGGVTTFTAATGGNIQITAIKVIYKRVAVPLDAPQVTVDDYGVVTWTEVTGASGYAYKINDGETVTVAKDAELKYDKLANGQTIKVWAVGSAEDYLSDSTAVEKTYTQTQLEMSTVSVDEGGLAHWDAVEGASGYAYILLNNNDEKVGEGELDKDTCFKQLGNGQKIQVMAVGEGLYISSGYTDPSDLFTVTGEVKPCGIPDIEIARNGKVTIKKVTGAASYKYIVTNAEGVDQTEVPVTNLATLNLILNDNEKIKAMAVGNGTTHTDGSYPETSVQYKAATKLEIAKPTVKPEGTTAGKVIVEFAVVANATGYKYTIDSEDATAATLVTVTEKDGVASFTIDLAEGKVIRVMAIGNENAEDYAPVKLGDYSNGYDSSNLSAPETFTISNTKTYSVAEILPIIAYYGTTESSKTFTVKGNVVVNEEYYTKNGTMHITIADEANNEITVYLYSAKVPADFANTTANLLTTVTTKITATGKVKVYEKTTDGNTTQTPQVSSPEVTIDISAADRFALAVPVLTGMKEDLEKDISEDITLPVSLFGATISWTINETNADKLAAAKAAFKIDDIDEKGLVKVLPAQDEIAFTLVATLKVGETTYNDAENKLNYSVKIPADDGETTAIFNADYVTANNWTPSAGSDVTTYTDFDLDSVINITLSGGNSGSWWGSDLRFYENASGSKLTITTKTATYKITSITFTYTTSNNGALIYNSTNYDKNQSPLTINDINSQSVEFGVTHVSGSSNGQVRFTEIKIKYRELTNEEKAIAALDIGKKYEDNSFTVPASDETYGVNFTWTSSDETVATVSGNTVTVHKSGDVTLTASCGEGLTKDFEIKVTKPLTLADKVTEALNAIKIDEVGYEGTYFNILTYYEKYDLTISWDSSDKSVVDFEDGKAIIKDDGEVTLTASIDCDCGVDAHHTRTFDDIMVLYSDAHTHEYTYTPNSDGTTHNGVCECGEDPIVNEAHNYDNDTDTMCNKCGYERTIGNEPTTPTDIEVTIKTYGENEANGWTKSEGNTVHTGQDIIMDEVITVTAAGNNNSGSWWGDDWRIYQTGTPSGTFTISAKEGYIIQSVEITFSAANNGVLTHGDDTYGTGTGSNTITVSDIDDSSITFGVAKSAGKTGTNGQAKITYIKVTYIKAN